MTFRDSPIRWVVEVGQESADAITATLTLGTASGDIVPMRSGILVWCSDRSDVARAALPDGGWQAGSTGSLVEISPGVALALVSAETPLTIVLRHSGAGSFYLGAQMTDGAILVSPEMRFQAGA